MSKHVNIEENEKEPTVYKAFYRGSVPRVYVDSSPHFVSNAGLTLAEWRHFTGSTRYRHISNYGLDGENARIL